LRKKGVNSCRRTSRTEPRSEWNSRQCRKVLEQRCWEMYA
jgi:hypothetical protein